MEPYGILTPLYVTGNDLPAVIVDFIHAQMHIIIGEGRIYLLKNFIHNVIGIILCWVKYFVRRKIRVFRSFPAIRVVTRGKNICQMKKNRNTKVLKMRSEFTRQSVVSTTTHLQNL